MPSTRTYRLRCSEFHVDLRLRQVRGVWLGSADTPDGPTLGWGRLPINAAIMALEPYDGVIEELLASISNYERP
jgi:hypothetical protein